MRTIYKYKFDNLETMTVPDGKVVLVGYQGDASDELPTVWIEQDIAPNRWQRLFFIGTGYMVNPDAEHVGSAICGRFVWHVYQRNDT